MRIKRIIKKGENRILSLAYGFNYNLGNLLENNRWIILLIILLISSSLLLINPVITNYSVVKKPIIQGITPNIITDSLEKSISKIESNKIQDDPEFDIIIKSSDIRDNDLVVKAAYQDSVITASHMFYIIEKKQEEKPENITISYQIIYLITLIFLILLIIYFILKYKIIIKIKKKRKKPKKIYYLKLYKKYIILKQLKFKNLIKKKQIIRKLKNLFIILTTLTLLVGALLVNLEGGIIGYTIKESNQTIVDLIHDKSGGIVYESINFKEFDFRKPIYPINESLGGVNIKDLNLKKPIYPINKSLIRRKF